MFVGECGEPRKPKEFAMMNNVLNYADFIKSQNKKNIFSHPDVQQRILMMMGEEKNRKLELDHKEENKIAKDYSKMYFALATIRWCRGESLGMARQKSLEQMNSFVQSKKNVAHPMNKYLMAINNQMHREVAQLNMTDENSDKKIEIHSDLVQKWAKEATEVFQQCLKELNDMYKKYMPEKDIKQQPATIKFELAQKKTQQMMQQLLAQQLQRSA